MSKLYLITGFLGAGKTTFLKNFIRLFEGKKIQLIVNEFGKEGVDGILLSDLGAFLNEISGGSVFCSCRLDQFEKVLQESKNINPDIIIVEASGLSDPTGVKKLFSQTDRFPNIEYQGAVCLVDAVRFPKVYATARTCVKQIASSDVAVINKIDLATNEQLENTINLITTQRPNISLIKTSFGKIDKSILNMVCCDKSNLEQNIMFTADLTLRNILIKISPTITKYELEKFIEMFLETTFRVKGFIQTIEGEYLVDCVGNIINIEKCVYDIPNDKKGNLVVLSGSGMPVQKYVKEAVKWYEKYIIDVKYN